MENKAQAGLEYLMTYGWALVLVATVVGSLVFILGSPIDDESFQTSDPTKFLIKGGQIIGDQALVKLQNTTGGEIRITDLLTSGYTGCSINGNYEIEGITISPGGEIEILCTLTQESTKTITVEYEDQLGLEDTVTVTSSGGNTPLGPGGETICDDGFDNDGDTLIDCADPNCHGAQGTGGTCEYGEELTCNDSFDNDADTFTDCLDEDCYEDPACESGIAISSCPADLDQEGETYVLTGDISSNGDCITISADNIVLDCQNNTITGNGSGDGIYSEAGNLTIENCTVENFNNGLKLVTIVSAGGNTVRNNTFNSNENSGLRVYYSPNNILTGNTASNNGIHGIYLEFCSNATISENTLNNNSTGLEWMGQTDPHQPETATITNNEINGNDNYGMSIGNSDGSTITGNTINNNGSIGIYNYRGNGDTMSNNTSCNNDAGDFRCVTTGSITGSGNQAGSVENEFLASCGITSVACSS